MNFFLNDPNSFHLPTHLIFFQTFVGNKQFFSVYMLEIVKYTSKQGGPFSSALGMINE